MKKLTLTIVCGLALSSAAFAQGVVNWGTITAAAMTAQTNSQTYSPLFGGGSAVGGATGLAGGAATLGTGFYFQLLDTSYSGGAAVAKPTTLSALLTWSDSGLSASNSTTAGRLSPINPTAAANVPWGGATAATGVTNSVMLVGWSANFGTSWAQVSGELAYANANGGAITNTAAGLFFFGESNTGYIWANTSGTGPAVFGTAASANGLPISSLLTPLYLIPVPEPTTLALAGLGGLAMLMIRRRK